MAKYRRLPLFFSAALIVLFISVFFSPKANALALPTFEVGVFDMDAKVAHANQVVQIKTETVELEVETIKVISHKEQTLKSKIKQLDRDIKKLKEKAKKKKIERQKAAPVRIARHAGDSRGNMYAPGTCTWYVKKMRPDIGNFWGNANSWYSSARSQGWSVGSHPKVGAIATTQAGAYGHVAYVTSVSKDRRWATIKEMNYGGPWITNVRTVPASSFQYIYSLT